MFVWKTPSAYLVNSMCDLFDEIHLLEVQDGFPPKDVFPEITYKVSSLVENVL